MGHIRGHYTWVHVDHIRGQYTWVHVDHIRGQYTWVHVGHIRGHYSWVHECHIRPCQIGFLLSVRVRVGFGVLNPIKKQIC